MKVQVISLDEALLEKGRGKDKKPRKKRTPQGSQVEQLRQLSGEQLNVMIKQEKKDFPVKKL